LRRKLDYSSNDHEFTHNYLAVMKVRSLLKNQIIQNNEDNVENILSEDKEDDKSYEISEVKTKKQSLCVIFNNAKEEIGCYNSAARLISLT
ncbi:22132_t:CDS:1, partial [Cetraspora pellucida]